MKGLSSIVKPFLIFCLLRGWQGNHAVPEYVLYLYNNISISGGSRNTNWPLSSCLQACNEDPACEAVDWDGSCWFHYSSSSCSGLGFVSNVRHYQMKRCPDNPAYNCPCSTNGMCVRTYTSATEVYSEECVCKLGRTGDQCLGYVECTAPAIPNAAPSLVPGGYRIGSNVTYTCNTGYQLSDGSGTSFTLTCSPRGTFEGKRKTCTIVECTVLTISNAAHSPDTKVYIFGSNITYTCSRGYQLSDGSGNSFTLTCGPRGTFEGERKACNRTCDLPVGDHLRQVTQRSVTFEGQTATYTCHTGFRFNDTSIVKNLTCQSDGTFDQSLHSCIPISCGFPTDKINLKAVEGPYEYKQNVTFSCIPGYHFAGYDVESPFTSQCIATETLEPPIPDCIRRTCSLPHFNNTVAPPDSMNLLFMASVEFKCIKGFQFPDGNASVTLTCDETGGFGVDSLSCTAVLSDAGTKAASTDPNIGVSVGVSVTGAIVLILVAVIIVVFVKRRRKQMSNSNADIDVSRNGKLSKTLCTTSKAYVNTNIFELQKECAMTERYDQSNNMKQNYNNENQASDVQDLYAVPDKSRKTNKGKKQQNAPVNYPDDAYEYVSKPSAQASPVSRQDCSSTHGLAGQFQNGGYAQSVDDADDVEFVENDIYETGGVDNMGHTCVESAENDI